jgi:mono/diheme cytochrome c family protein
MKHFVLGVLVTILALVGGVYFFLRLGFLDLRADQQPSRFEDGMAMKFLDASVGRRARQRPNPFQASTKNLEAGLNTYETHCSLCHGDPANRRSPVGTTLYPPAPQFLEKAPDMPENQNFYIIRNGVRWTGMPGWKKVLSRDQIWKLTAFLAHIQHLPPAVQQEWKSAASLKSSTPTVKEQGANRHE